MKFTLNKIKEKHPCTSGWRTLLASLNKTEAADEELEVLFIKHFGG